MYFFIKIIENLLQKWVVDILQESIFLFFSVREHKRGLLQGAHGRKWAMWERIPLVVDVINWSLLWGRAFHSRVPHSCYFFVFFLEVSGYSRICSSVLMRVQSCGSQPQLHIRITWILVPRPHSRPLWSESLRMGPSMVFKTP